MNLFDLFAKITLDTSDYNDGVANVMSRAEALTKTLNNAGQSTDTMANKITNLSDKYNNTQSEIKSLTEEISKSSSETNIASTQSQDLTNKLETTAQEASNLKQEMSALSKSTNDVSNTSENAGDSVKKFSSNASDAQKKSQGFGDAVSSLANKLGFDLPEGLVKSLNSMGNLSTKILAVVAAATSATAAIVKLEKALISMTKTASTQARQLINLSSAIGMTTTQAQEWDYVLQSVGSSLEEAQGDLSMFQERMLEATTGEGEAAEMFSKLGVAVSDATGKLRPAGDVLREVVDQLSNMTNVTDRNATSSILLGGTGERLTAIYDQQAGALDELINKKRENGIVSEEELALLAETDTALRDLSNTSDTVKTKLASQFAPAMTNATEKLGEFISGLGEKLEQTGIVDAVGNILIAATGLLEPLGILVSTILPALKPLLDAVAPALALLADTATVITGILTLSPSTIARGLGFDRQSAQANLYYGNQGYSFNTTTGQWYDPNVKTYDELYADYESDVLSGRYAGTFDAWRQSGGDTYNITIDAKNVQEFNDIVNIAKNQRRLGRMYT